MANQKTVIVTGASSDIGLAVCRQCIDAGHKVVAHFRTPRPELEALIAEGVEGWRFDLSDTASLEEALRKDLAFFQRADMLFNLAASLDDVSFETADAEAVIAALRVNTLPGLLLMQHIGPAMAARGWGRIVHASSIGVKFGGSSDSFTYSFSKHAMEFIPSACRKWASDGVLTNIVRVGVTNTRIHSRNNDKDLQARSAMIPMGRMAEPDEMAGTLYWLGSDQNAYVTGQVISASGGE